MIKRLILFCPKCKYEYRKDIKKCPDCGSALVDRLEDGEKPVVIKGDNDLVYTGDISDVSEIQIIKAFLDEKGIFYFLKEDTPNKAAMGAGPVPFNGLAVRASLYIEKNRMEEALELIRDIKEAQVDISDMDWTHKEEENPDRYETAELCEVENDFEADALKNILSQEGIYSFVRNNVLPSTGISLFFFKRRGKGTVIVNKEDLDRAKKIWKEFKGNI